MLKYVELRKLNSDLLCKVVDILEINDDWKKMMSVIPKSLQNDSVEPKYNNEHIRLIEEHAKINHLKCSEVLIGEWGTSGRVRPTLVHLKDILSRAQIYRAADEIAVMLGEPKPIRPSFGPGATVDTNVTDILAEESRQQRLYEIGSINKSQSNELCNKTTQEMKSASDMIEFSEIIVEEPITILKSYGNRTTEQIATLSDMMKFTEEQQKEHSMNLPNLTAMMNSNSNPNSHSMSVDTDTETDVSHTNNENKNSSHYYPENYQTSFPNISISITGVNGIDSVILKDRMLIHFEYEDLKSITGNFSEVLTYGSNGLKGKIGSGGFGDVYVGSHPKYGTLAVKKGHSQLQLHRKPEIAMKVFNAEVKFLSQFRHINIVPILGFSRDGPAPCIVCEYIEGGSLMTNIKAKILDKNQRINIMLGTAEGLKYLHTSKTLVESKDTNSSILRAAAENDSQNTTKNFVHGDVKTANILLTKDCVPKLCDFGLAKQCDATYLTTCPMGTSAYMAPEGIHGTITQKIDIFSFGIVLLELLTGLNPIAVIDNEKIHIKLYVEENIVNNDISPIVDPIIMPWTKANEIYDLAKCCLENNRKSRPTITEVCDILNRIKN